MNATGEEVSIEDSFGCKVTHNIKHTDYVLILDKVGGNTNQKGNGNVGGELMMCERGKNPQKKINTKDKHYIVIAPTSLSGKPIISCIIFTGTKSNALVETGLELTAETIGDVSDDIFCKQ